MKLPARIREQFVKAGARGGHRRAAVLTEEELSASGKKAVAARWLKYRAKNFAEMIYTMSPGTELNLWNFQGYLPMRLSAYEHNQVPAEQAFAEEIAACVAHGWLKELPEDVEFTEQKQLQYGRSGIRYGATYQRIGPRRSAAGRAKFQDLVAAIIEAKQQSKQG